METIRLQAEDTVVEVVPERGALVTRCDVGPRELLWLDPATVEDRSRNVRGGIPVLFPFAGGLPDLGQLRLALSPALRFLQFWSLPGKPFVCLEPFFGAPGTINDPTRRDEVPSRSVRSYAARFELLP